MSSILDWFRRLFLRRHCRRLAEAIESGLLDGFLEVLLKAMRLLFLVDNDFRRNIDGFDARYAFASKDGKIACSAAFSGSRMEVHSEKITPAHVTVYFKNSEALMRFLFQKDPDLIGAILENDIVYDGNLNYLVKLAYMAKHLQLMFSI